MIDIADNIEKIRPGRPGLKVVFLITLAEGITKLLFKETADFTVGSKRRVKTFFNAISKQDKNILRSGILKSPYEQKFRISTLIDVFYNIRNRVLHEGIFYEFFFNYDSHGSTLTDGYAGTRGKKKRVRKVLLDIQISYEDFRNVVARTAINNIIMSLDK